MKKKSIIVICIAVVVIAGVGTVYATRNHGENSSDDPSYKLGKMIQQQDQEGDTSDELYAVGKDIQITKQEMENQHLIRWCVLMLEQYQWQCMKIFMMISLR